MVVRDKLKALYEERYKLDTEITLVTEEYIKELSDGDVGIYVTDHAIVRYIERVMDISIEHKDTDQETLQYSGLDIADIRKRMLFPSESRRLLRARKLVGRVDGYTYIMKNLSVITILK